MVPAHGASAAPDFVEGAFGELQNADPSGAAVGLWEERIGDLE